MRNGDSKPRAGESDLLRDDRGVLDAFRRGERAAMERVFLTYEPLVRTVVRNGFGGFRGFRSPADQDDMVQTVFLAAFEGGCRQRYDGLTPYSSFLRGLAHNQVRQRLSKNARFTRTDGAPPPSHPSETTPEDALACEEEQAVVARFVASITDEHERAVLQRYFVAGEAEETLAKSLGITRYRLRKTIARLHKQMTRHLGAHDVGVV
jgi:RNA polymerase sigma factor (sigma-70 family)